MEAVVTELTSQERERYLQKLDIGNQESERVVCRSVLVTGHTIGSAFWT